MNELWMLICASFVFFMQAGFTCYETGFVNSKNVISVAIENMFNLAITIVVFALVGFPLMFGETAGGIIGTSFWMFSGLEDNYAFFFLHIMFAAVSVTIFAGALSERTKLGSLLIAGCVSGGLIYPVFGHWAWGGMLTGRPSWLESLGFMDFAGASVVHMTAGFIALAGLIVVGPRMKTNTGKSNIPLAVLGVFILWFGWFGFNGACIQADNPGIARVFVNTNMAAACGTLGALLINLIVRRKGGYLLSLFNGVLGGLVAITAVSAYCSPQAAMLLGLAAGILSDLVSSLLKKLGIDDVVNVVPVHLAGGITGSLCLPFIIDSEFLQTGSRLEQFGVQGLGVAVNCIWAFGTAYLFFRILDRTAGLRVTAEEEKKGLNIVEFSDIYSWQNYIETSAYESEIRDKNKLLRKQARLLAVTEEQEKNRLARDLHDSVGQSLSALKMILGMGRKQAEEKGDAGLVQTSVKAAELADISIKEIRNVLNNLKPEILQREGLEAAMESMVRNLDEIGNLDCELLIEDPLPYFDDTVELNIYRLVQEALNNVVKHSHARHAKVVCGKGNKVGMYVFAVEDDGKSFDSAGDKSGVGLDSMRDRISMLGGEFNLYCSEGKGTKVVMEVPYNE